MSSATGTGSSGGSGGNGGSGGTTPGFIKTVGFSATAASTTTPIAIPAKVPANPGNSNSNSNNSNGTVTVGSAGNRNSSAVTSGSFGVRISPSHSHSSPEKKPVSVLSQSLNNDLKNYKSQLSGWSDEVALSTSPASPKSSSSVPVRDSTDFRKQINQTQTSPIISASNGASTNSGSKEKKSPVSTSGSGNAEKYKLSKQERKAQYQQQLNQKQSQRENQSSNSGGAGSLPKSAGISSSVSNPTTGSSSNTSTATTAAISGTSASTSASVSAGSKSKPSAVMQFDDSRKRAKADKKKILQLPVSIKQVGLFSHLPQYEHHRPSSQNYKVWLPSASSENAESADSTSNYTATPSSFNVGGIHPVIIELGIKYAQGAITGSNARAVALLNAFKKVISDYTVGVGGAGVGMGLGINVGGLGVASGTGTLFRDLDIKPLVQYLVDCRPLSISMGNAINYLKLALANTKKFQSQNEAKEYVISKIDTFIQERIVVADEMIVKYGVSRIQNGDVLMTYARSLVVESLLKKAHDEGKKFRVIIVDSRPKREGKEFLHRLVEYGLDCTYVLLNAVSYIMKEVSKVFVGAYTMLSNGNLISRVGTALIAMMANNYHIPFIVCCETYKFTERVQSESISFNELGDPEEVCSQENNENEETSGASSSSNLSSTSSSSSLTSVSNQLLKEWRDTSNQNLKLLNLVYDLTPAEFIGMVITEVGMVPPTSVPVILREYRTEPTAL